MWLYVPLAFVAWLPYSLVTFASPRGSISPRSFATYVAEWFMWVVCASIFRPFVRTNPRLVFGQPRRPIGLLDPS